MDTSTFKILIDSPSTKPVLGYDEYAKCFSEIICKSTPQFTIGIFGGWGSGKTTLMQAIKSELPEESTISIEFSAWRYEKESHLIIPLLATIQDQLVFWASKKEKTLKEKGLKTAKTIGKVITSMLAGLKIEAGISEVFKISYDVNDALENNSKAHDPKTKNDQKHDLKSTYYICFKALKEAFEEFQKGNNNSRIIIFVDDLDRCLPNGVIQVLESMKLFFDLSGFIFVVGLDQNVIEWCIDNQYKDRWGKETDDKDIFQIKGADYIKKIFQVPFNLLPVSLTQLGEFLCSLIRDNELSLEQESHIIQEVKPHLKFLIDSKGLNPREIKRFLNAYTLNIKMKPLLNPHSILAIKVITFRKDWGMILEAIYSYGDIFLDALRRFTLENHSNALINLDPKFENIPNSFINYVSDGPGSSILNAKPLEEYIKSCIAVDTYGDSQTLELVRIISDLRPKLESCRSKQDVKVFGSELQKLNHDFVSISNNKNRSQSNLVTKKCYDNLFDQALRFSDTDDINALNVWREKMNQDISNLITSLVDQYQSTSY
jgi:hypothetical protein